LLWLVALALFGSFISLYYYLIVLRAIFVDEVGAQVPQKPEIDVRPAAAWNVDLLQRITVAVLALAILFFGVMPETLAARIMASLP
jgi:NADH:ubiquinone oxidoreductase subunit 2 (subunit N)